MLFLKAFLRLDYMTEITFIANGTRRSVTAEDGESLLEVAHKHDVDLEGACGGALACATCHVIIGDRWYDKLPAASEEEKDMLDMVFRVNATSRLGCQVKVNSGLDGMEVTVPPADRK